MSVVMEANQGQSSLLICDIQMLKVSSSSPEFRLWGALRTPMVASVECEIIQFNMTANDCQELQRDPQTIPSPRIDDERLSHRFHLDVNQEILYCHLIGHDKCLLVLKDGGGNTAILFDRIIELGQRKKMLRNLRTSSVIRVAYDEEKRMLLVCDASKRCASGISELHPEAWLETFHPLFLAFLAIRPVFPDYEHGILQPRKKIRLV
ncbi:hypothetical protein C8J56DRAFT_893857 [Mycena floridula]|nr:hypothetical protein C8J56DRAFT_893857 [Mycena floridula]